MTIPASDTTKEAAVASGDEMVVDAMVKMNSNYSAIGNSGGRESKYHSKFLSNRSVLGSVVSERHYLPNAVSTPEELADVPEKYLSGDPKRPLLLTIAPGESYKYALNPVTYCVLAILTIEMLERLAYYGINNTETEFLTGGYDSEWNPGFDGPSASAFTSSSVAIAYTTPFVGGIVADGAIGDFWAVVFGVSVFYLPGLLLISLTTFPYLLGPTFNLSVLKAGLLGLMPTGAGFIKPIVNVFGAKQFHPVVQSSLIEPYYVNFYMAINIGGIIGGIAIPIIAQQSDEIAYLIPFITMFLGFALFLCFSPRFVKRKPERAALCNTLGLFGKQIFCCRSLERSKTSNGGRLEDPFVDGVYRLLKIVPVNLLVLPFNIVYTCMVGVFILQGQAMKQAAFVDASWMNNFDNIGVLLTGAIAGSWLYPMLERKGINFPYCYRFSVGSVFGALAIASALIVDYEIRKQYRKDGSEVNVLAQAMNFFLVGAGEIFAVSTAYEAAFTIAPKEQKCLASAIQLFMGNGLASYVQIGLNQGLGGWLPKDKGVQNYVDSEMYKYLWMLFGICIGGALLNLIPQVKNWVERIRNEGLDATAMGFTEQERMDESNLEMAIPKQAGKDDAIADSERNINSDSGSAEIEC